jgi:hypothetical protein
MSGLTGGIGGTLVAFVAYFLMLNFIPSDSGSSSLSVFAIIIMAFAATLSANTLTATMVTFMDNEKYSRRKTIITHVFMFNLILFFLTIPLYLIAVPLDIVNGIAALHFLLSAYVSALLMEIFAGYEYSVVGVYATSLGIFISISLALVVVAGTSKPLVITLGAMPIVWLILQTTSGLVELVYDNFLHLYGVDALNTSTDLGGDSVVEKEEEEDDAPTA